jgi:hypothetical protein
MTDLYAACYRMSQTAMDGATFAAFLGEMEREGERD